MRTFTYTEHIDRAPADVFAFMMDFSQASRWRNLVRRMEIVGGGPVREGCEIVVTFDIMGKTRQIVYAVGLRSATSVRPAEYRIGVTGIFEYTLRPHATGTTVTVSADVRPHGSCG